MNELQATVIVFCAVFSTITIFRILLAIFRIEAALKTEQGKD